MKSDQATMPELKVRRWTGLFGLATFVVFLAALPLYLLGPPAVLPQDASFGNFVNETSTDIIARATIADPIILSCFLVFLAGLRHMVQAARRDYEWISTLILGIGLLYVTLQLVGDALQGAGALDVVAGANQAAVRALFEGSTPLYASVGLIPEAFFFAFTGYAILASGVLPRWVGWMAYIGAIITFADAPTVYFGFGGLVSGVLALFAAVAEFWLPAWFLAASVPLLRKPAPTPNHA
ncbi:MAG TPA: DUF4386 family protein [Nitrososphaerales archaeon]|nr:DUF4386 family protein [Nitrososphaerales archaeon]